MNKIFNQQTNLICKIACFFWLLCLKSSAINPLLLMQLMKSLHGDVGCELVALLASFPPQEPADLLLSPPLLSDYFPQGLTASAVGGGGGG